MEEGDPAKHRDLVWDGALLLFTHSSVTSSISSALFGSLRHDADVLYVLKLHKV